MNNRHVTEQKFQENSFNALSFTPSYTHMNDISVQNFVYIHIWTQIDLVDMLTDKDDFNDLTVFCENNY